MKKVQNNINHHFNDKRFDETIAQMSDRELKELELRFLRKGNLILNQQFLEQQSTNKYLKFFYYTTIVSLVVIFLLSVTIFIKR
jgi:hypothetical protein